MSNNNLSQIWYTSFDKAGAKLLGNSLVTICKVLISVSAEEFQPTLEIHQKNLTLMTTPINRTDQCIPGSVFARQSHSQHSAQVSNSC